MAVSISWPAALPAPARAGYKIQPRPALIRSDMEQGSARQRRRSTATMTDVPAAFSLTQWQLLLFESFLEHRAAHGAQWFGIDLVGGVGLVAHEARFKGEVEIVPLGGGVWSVTGTLEIRERPILTAADLAILEDEDPDVLGAAIVALHLIMTDGLWTS